MGAPGGAAHKRKSKRTPWGRSAQAQVEEDDASDRARKDCPLGTRRIGDAPPGDHEEYCVRIAESGPPVKHGPYRKWAANGNLILEGRYEEGKQQGRWSEYYDSGRDKRIIEYEDGVYDGAWTKWYESGQKWAEGTYREGKKHGRGRFWYESGQLKADGLYRDDIREGKSTNWYESGQIRSVGNYVDGKRDGPWIDYHEEGQAIESVYEAGQKISP
jgi:antitoxin component YwqK of YwqJK toxin-antitoxin module